MTGGLVEQVQHAIHVELGEGRAIMAAVAGRLQVSERTLRRRLNDHGATFRAVLDEVRCERALHALHARSCSGAELAGRLGFSCPTAFYRAFRRWTGTSLSRYDWRPAAPVSDSRAGESTSPAGPFNAR
jgi:AraC-like DNA-binding protein